MMCVYEERQVPTGRIDIAARQCVYDAKTPRQLSRCSSRRTAPPPDLSPGGQVRSTERRVSGHVKKSGTLCTGGARDNDGRRSMAPAHDIGSK